MPNRDDALVLRKKTEYQLIALQRRIFCTLIHEICLIWKEHLKKTQEQIRNYKPFNIHTSLFYFTSTQLEDDKIIDYYFILSVE